VTDPRIYRRIFEDLRQQITSGQIPLGTALPVTRVLMDRYDCSRDTVQRGLQLLADEGLIIRWPGLGYYVADKLL
jgi:GntR family transcriptional regulator of arabinose operon